MNIQTQNIFRTTFPVKDDECIGRHLVSISATPNPTGGCSTIVVSFQSLGWILGDEPTILTWTDVNSGEVFSINGCIDLTTLDYGECFGRITFVWNDSIDCCTV